MAVRAAMVELRSTRSASTAFWGRQSELGHSKLSGEGREEARPWRSRRALGLQDNTAARGTVRAVWTLSDRPGRLYDFFVLASVLPLAIFTCCKASPD